MPRLTSRIALLAVAGILSAAPALAAPMASSSSSNGGNNGGTALDCSLPQNQNSPYCVQLKGRNSQSSGPMVTGGPNGGSGPNNGPNNKGPNGGSNQNNSGGPPNGSFNFNQHDRDQFHQRFRGFNFGNFGFFASPSFSITIGTPLPHSYQTHLRPVPYSIYRYYPWFRGYLYFVDSHGDFVIVDAHRFHIVAVL